MLYFSRKEPSDCHECRNVRDGPNCSAKCPESKYVNASNSCELCHKDCRDGCTGPGNHLGFEGCNACHLVMVLKEEKPFCLPVKLETCDDGFYKFFGRLDVATQNGTKTVQVVSAP